MNWQPNPGHRPDSLLETDTVHVRVRLPDGSVNERTWPVTSRGGSIQWGKGRAAEIVEWAKA